MNDIATPLQLLRVAIMSVLLLPTVAIAVAWFRFSRSLGAIGNRRFGSVIVLILLTCSQGFILAGLAASRVIGPDYSSRRYGTIFVNLGLMVVAASIAAILGG